MAADGAEPVVKEIYIEAEPATVFEFFVDADKMCRWLALEATLDPRPGGVCIQVHDGVDRGGGRCVMEGTFVAVEPPRRVAFTWGFADPAVHVKPGGSVVEVTLEPSGAGTRVVLVHRGLPPDEVVNHDDGWTTMLTRLAQAVGSQPLIPGGRDEKENLMSAIRHEVWINADATTVFDALTTQPGLDGWWGKALSAEPKVGHVIEFDHGHSELLRMRITELEPNERVAWRCVSDFTDPGYPGSEWLGHELRFELRPAADDPLAGRLLGILFDADSGDRVTILRLEQRGWSADDRWSAFCNSAWGATLAGPLKSYCEGSNGPTDT